MKSEPSKDPAALRRMAEMRLRLKPSARHPQTDADQRRLQHELEVHQIELEMQNEELHRSQAEVEELLMKYTGLYDFAPTGYYTLDREGIIRGLNLAGAALLGRERSALGNRLFGLFVTAEARPAFGAFLKNAFKSGTKEVCEIQFLQEARPARWVWIEACAEPSGTECLLAAMDITARKEGETERERLIAELQAALGRVKLLSGLLPICAGCKKIRDEAGSWHQIEIYIKSHSAAEFTHGLCPACINTFYPNLGKFMLAKQAPESGAGREAKGK